MILVTKYQLNNDKAVYGYKIKVVLSRGKLRALGVQV